MSLIYVTGPAAVPVQLQLFAQQASPLLRSTIMKRQGALVHWVALPPDVAERRRRGLPLGCPLVPDHLPDNGFGNRVGLILVRRWSESYRKHSLRLLDYFSEPVL